jgi:hypothetical protein
MELARFEAVQELCPAVLDEPQRDARGRATPAREEAGQALERLGCGSEAEYPRLTGAGRPGSLAERLRMGEEVAALSEQILSRAGDAHSTADAIEEPDAEVLLELADSAPEGRLADAKTGCGFREAPSVSHRDEVAEVPEVHEVLMPLRHELWSK